MTTEQVWIGVDEIVESELIPTSAEAHNHSAGSAAAAEAAEKAAAAAGLPPIAVTLSQGKFLALLARATKARQVLEVGTLGGVSAIWLAGAVEAGTGKDTAGHVTTVEIEAKNADTAEAAFRQAGLDKGITVLRGAGLDVLPKVEQEILAGTRPRFDFSFIDADKVNNWAYFDIAVRCSNPGAAIVIDNAIRNGKIVDEELCKTDENVGATRELFRKIGADRRVDATALQTVAGKGYDGFLLAVVN